MTDTWDEYLQQRRNRGFGDILAVSGQTEYRAAAGLHAAAENLVNKALVALEDGDEDRAIRLATRASRLPWDDFEQRWPGALAAHMALYEALTEAMESSDEGQTAWLDDAIRVLGELTGEIHEHVADTLGTFAWDAGLDPTPAEVRKIRQAVGANRQESRFGADPTATPDQLLPRILDILRVTNRYHLVHVHGQ